MKLWFTSRGGSKSFCSGRPMIYNEDHNIKINLRSNLGYSAEYKKECFQ